VFSYTPKKKIKFQVQKSKMHVNKNTAAFLLPVLAVMLVSSSRAQTTNQFSTTAASVVAEKFTKKPTGMLHKLGEQHDNTNNNNNESQNYNNNKKFSSFMNEKSSKVANVAAIVNESETEITAMKATTTTASLLNVINSKTEIDAGKQDVISQKPGDTLGLDDDWQPYEEFTLLEEIPPTQTTQTPVLDTDRQHIFKVSDV
jgi:hypothetical protein